jgi:hypothetical protein
MHQPGPNWQLRAEVKAQRDFPPDQLPELCLPVRFGESRKVSFAELKVSVFGNDLNGPFFLVQEPAAEHLMARDYREEGTLESLPIQGAGDTDGGCQVVKATAGLQLLEKPQTLLRERERANCRVLGGLT